MAPSYNVTPLGDRVWAIDEGWVQGYLIVGSAAAVLFDCCASGGEEFKAAVDAVTALPVQLVFSHTDGDHTGAQDCFGPPLLHPAEYDYYAAKGNAGREVRPVWEGDVLDLGGVRLEVVLIPGHTPGHIALLDRAGRRLFAGDTLSDRSVWLFGPGRNLPAYLASLRKLEGLASAFDVIHAGHGSLELGAEWVARHREAAELLAAGTLTPADPPDNLPCRLYSHAGVNLLYP
ncbi:MAG: MBL fold metallo-hydrolase [Propionibacteriaceae bacterium]|jgi:glyoxylase-like metal-dependent hydrolase (beta-lactamase superfamily II)|nr:MBL fold metallo-hydrolase [Propionibacteriaceae bacterium]